MGGKSAMAGKAKVCPEATANIFSKYSYSWLDEFIKLGRRKTLEADDLYELDTDRQTAHLVSQLSYAWQAELKLDSPSLVHAIYTHYFWHKVFPIGMYRFVSDMGTNFSPYLLSLLIQFVSQAQRNKNPPHIGYGLSYALGLFFTQLFVTIVQNRFFLLSLSQGLEFRTAFIGLIFEKSTKLSYAARQTFNSGKVTNMVSSDAQRIESFVGFGHVLWTAPIQFTIIIALLIFLLGPAALAGVGMLILLGPAQKMLMGKVQELRKQVAPITDSRVRLIQEIISGIRVIKFFTWENPFLDQVKEIREKEVQLVRSRGFLSALMMAMAFSIPVFSASIALIIYGSYNPLDPSKIFAALALFNQLKFPLMFLPMVIVQFVEFKIALRRIEELLLAPEAETQSTPDSEAEFAVEIKDGSFVWDCAPILNDGALLNKEASKNLSPLTDSETTIKNININISRGQLVGICGAVGSGKSTLLNSILGETTRKSGSIKLSSTLGYAGQQAWIQNASIKDNILFGLPYDQSKYVQVIRHCALEKDLHILPDGDLTEIGERGINLSGGQKQRVNLARLLYFGSDIILMDDPLSAVDAHVGRYLFNNCIRKGMDGKTRLLVTHQLHFLPETDYIIVMKEGTIAEQGTYSQLISDRGEFYELMKSYGGPETEKEKLMVEDKNHDEEKIELKRIDDALALKGTHNAREIMQKEDRAVGSVNSNIWRTYFTAAGGYVFLITLISALIALESTKIGTDAWLVVWSNNSFPDFTLGIYVGIYLTWGVSQTLSSYFVGLVFAYFGNNAARMLHQASITRLIHAPVSFFDATPLGRIINRFSKDQDGIDNQLMDAFRMFITTFMDTVAIFIVIIYTTPFFVVPLLPIGIFYWLIQSYYRATSREVKRLEAITRSPLYAHIGETLDGIPTIRAYRDQSRFIKQNEIMLNTTNSPSFLLISAARWMSLRLESLGALIVLSSALFGLFATASPWFSPALFGLSMTYSLQVTGTLNWCIRQFTDTEIAMNAVERVAFYGFSLPQEPLVESRAKDGWLLHGSVEFKNVSMRYTPELPLVIQNISFSVKAGEKVAFVGRTGSGKSSIMQSLFRMVEFEGEIIIDDVQTRSINIQDLRKSIGIIPQDPVLFSGPFRRNLDPFGEHSENDIWLALERANIKSKVIEMGGLDSLLFEGGENLSVGQRQLLCLARALVRKPVILVMDECTANVDYETDSIIQKCIREDLKTSTILTIAHRLVTKINKNTIIDYDKVIVLDHGKIIEFGSPEELILKKGAFYAMALETGDESLFKF